jgi:hypothetical protein
MLAGWIAVLALIGPHAFVFVYVVPLLVANATIMSYIATNHFPNPLGSGRYPLPATTTVAVPRLCDRLHSFFSFHTEHNLFPSLNPTYYPMVSVLQRRRPTTIGCRWRPPGASCMELFVEPAVSSPVVLSEAKDVLPVASGDGVLRLSTDQIP